jgi:predicted permease
MFDIAIEILTDDNFLGALFSALGFIFLGFVLRYKNIITNDTKKSLTFILLNVTLPTMAFCAFMTDFNEVQFKDNIIVFILSFLIYLLLIFIGKLLYIKKSKEDRKIYSIFVSVGQITFFTIPILDAVYQSSPNILMPANMMTLSFRIILYVYCYLVMSRLKFNKENLKASLKKIVLNPIMIGMVLGLIIWLTQNIALKITIDQIQYSIFRIDKTIPSIYMFIKLCSNLTTPLAMITIGCILGEAKLVEALKDKTAWIFAVLKTFILPLIVLFILTILQWLNLINFKEFEMVVLVCGYGAPLSAVVSTYASKYNNHDVMASRVCLLTILASVITFPILFILVKYFVTLPIFM